MNIKIKRKGSVIFRNNFNNVQVTEQVTEQVGHSIENYKELVLNYCKIPKSAKEIRAYLKLKSRNYVNYNIIKPLIDDEKLEYVNKNNIKASNQKYKTIDKTKTF